MSGESVTVRGLSGTVYWGYAVAATVTGWTAVRSGITDAGTITGTVATVDTFRISKQPLVFVVTHQKGSWRWSIQQLQIVDGHLTATICPKEP
jgi:hypothetical protein